MKIKRFLALTLAICLCFGALVFPVSANEAEFTASIDRVIDIVRDGLQNHQAEINVNYQIPADQFGGSMQEMQMLVGKILDEVAAPPYEHLQYSYICINTSFSMTSYSDIHDMHFRFNVEYYIDKQMNDRLEKEMDALLAKIVTRGMSDYEKIKAIYDWMCDNITYDYANLYDDSHTLKYTAYAALMNRTAVCQGYAELLDRLAAKVGVDSCMISGWQTSSGERHAWNILKLSGRYYNVDATWDTNYHTNDSYFYFLRCDKNFYDHTRDPKFTTESFYAMCPMSATDYIEVNDSCMINGHNYLGTITAPTCLEQGYTTYVCTVCDDVLVEDYTPTVDHQYVETVTKEPTCGAYGERTYKCSVCGVRHVEMIEKTEHHYIAEVFPATCTQGGLTRYQCSDCGQSYLDDYTDPIDHRYVAEVTPASCTTQGYTTYTCACGDSYRSDFVPAGSHNYIGTVTKEPTCGQNGEKTFTCPGCGDSYTQTLPMTGHVYVSWVVPATCTSDGYTVCTCTCGDSYVENYTEALGHDHVNNVCTRCGDTIPTGIEAPALKVTNKASSGKPSLSWDKVEGATKYQVYRATSKNGTYKRITTTSKTSTTNTSAVAGKTYYYYVVALDANGNQSEKSNIVKRVCDLAQPSIKVSNRASDGAVKISWEKVEGATKYQVYRATSEDGKYTRIGTTKNTSYNNTSGTAGKTYYYKVRAICDNEDAYSAYSSVKSCTRDLAQPKVKISTKSGKPYLKWDKIDGAVSYKIYRATSKNGKYSLLKTVTGLNYKDTSARKGKTYYYKVVAVCKNTGGNSAYSGIVSVKATK